MSKGFLIILFLIILGGISWYTNSGKSVPILCDCDCTKQNQSEENATEETNTNTNTDDDSGSDTGLIGEIIDAEGKQAAARNYSRLSDLKSMNSAFQMYMAEWGEYPTDPNLLVKGRYIKKLEEDPKTEKNYTYFMCDAGGMPRVVIGATLEEASNSSEADNDSSEIDFEKCDDTPTCWPATGRDPEICDIKNKKPDCDGDLVYCIAY